MTICAYTIMSLDIQRYYKQLKNHLLKYQICIPVRKPMIATYNKEGYLSWGNEVDWIRILEFLARKEEKLPTYISFDKMKKMFKGQKYRNRIYKETLIK